MSYTGFKGLGIRAKTLFALALTLGFAISVLVLTLRGFLLNGYLRSEDQEMAQAPQKVVGRIAVSDRRRSRKVCIASAIFSCFTVILVAVRAERALFRQRAATYS